MFAIYVLVDNCGTLDTAYADVWGEEPEDVIEQHEHIGNPLCCVHNIAMITISDDDYMAWKLIGEELPVLEHEISFWE